jgi:ammonium transporter, Amt family
VLLQVHQRNTALVGITPSAGYVAPWAAIVIGALTAATCNLAVMYKDAYGAYDALDAFYLHGVGGFVGCILTGIFAQKWVGLLDGSIINGGAIDGNGVQIGYQLAGAIAIAAYSFIGSIAILFVINLIPGMNIRLASEHESIGVDAYEMGEAAFEIKAASTGHLGDAPKDSEQALNKV